MSALTAKTAFLICSFLFGCITSVCFILTIVIPILYPLHRAHTPIIRLLLWSTILSFESFTILLLEELALTLLFISSTIYCSSQFFKRSKLFLKCSHEDFSILNQYGPYLPHLIYAVLS